MCLVLHFVSSCSLACSRASVNSILSLHSKWTVFCKCSTYTIQQYNTVNSPSYLLYKTLYLWSTHVVAINTRKQTHVCYTHTTHTHTCVHAHTHVRVLHTTHMRVRTTHTHTTHTHTCVYAHTHTHYTHSHMRATHYTHARTYNTHTLHTCVYAHTHYTHSHMHECSLHKYKDIIPLCY